MQTITVERTIAAPIERVFDWCATTTNWQSSKWVLRNKLVMPGRAAPYGVGAVRLHTWLVGRFYERITSYDPPHSYRYIVDRGLPPSRHDGGSMTFTEVPGGTDVVWSTSVEVAVPIGADLATRLIAKPMLTHVFGQILNSCARDLAG